MFFFKKKEVLIIYDREILRYDFAPASGISYYSRNPDYLHVLNDLQDLRYLIYKRPVPIKYFRYFHGTQLGVEEYLQLHAQINAVEF